MLECYSDRRSCLSLTRLYVCIIEFLFFNAIEMVAIINIINTIIIMYEYNQSIKKFSIQVHYN